MVKFLPLTSTQDSSVAKILSFIDDATQWAEDQVNHTVRIIYLIQIGTKGAKGCRYGGECR